MASTAAQSGGTSQFYINVANNSAKLDDNYAVFGYVISGMTAAYALANLQVYPGTLQNPSDQPINPSQAMLISVTISNNP